MTWISEEHLTDKRKHILSKHTQMKASRLITGVLTVIGMTSCALEEPAFNPLEGEE